MSTHWRKTNTSYGRRGKYTLSYTRLGSSAGPGRRSDTVPEPPSPPLGSLLATIARNDLVGELQSTSPNATPQIKDCKLVASYNWLIARTPTLLVPGMPPTWTPLSNAVKLPEDKGEYFRDQNAARYPSHPMQPAIEATLTHDPNFESNEVDIIGCGSTLGNLLRFSRNVDLSNKYRIIVEVVGSTVFFIRRENSPTQKIPDVRGYGHTFPEAYTTWDSEVRGSESHQRIIKYNFAGLICLVRFEGDGYLADMVPKELTTSAEGGSREHTAEGDLIAALENNTVSVRSPVTDEKLMVRKKGQVIPQSAVFDLKTRRITRKDADILGEQLPRLWISQIPNFVLAFHRFGVFEEIQTLDTRERVRLWEEEQKDNLGRFAALLKMLISFALGRPDGRFELIHEEDGTVLELREVEEDVPRALPERLKYRWTQRLVEGTKSLEEVKEPDDEELKHDWDNESEGSFKDYTACSASDCGYCGHCKY